MQANLNATTLTSSPAATERGARQGWRAWTTACHGAWQADWRERRRDWRVWLVTGVGLALAVCAALLSSQALNATLAARADASRSEQQRWSHQGKKYPHAAAHYGVYVFKPLSVLAALDPGVEHYVGSSVWLEAHKQNEMIYRPADDEPGATRQFRLTPALVLQVIAPMAMIFLGFGMFAGERERGTLASLRVSAAPLGAIALARGAVLLCLAAALVLPACIAVGVLEWSLDARSPSSDGTMRASLFAGAYLLYLCTWAALIAGISAWAPSLRTSLALLIGLWAATTLVLPRAAIEMAQLAAPLPTTQQFRAELDAALGTPDDPEQSRRDRQQLLRQYGVSDVKDLPVNWAGISLRRSEQHGDRLFDEHYGRLFGIMRRQDDAAALAGWLSPAVALGGLSAALAGSDTAHHIRFINGAEQQRRAIQEVMNTAIVANPEKNGVRYDGDQSLWNRVPPFQFSYAPLDPGALAMRQGLPLAVLFLASLLLCGAGLRHLRRGSLR
jgi:ABC-2 type transport system permease protein